MQQKNIEEILENYKKGKIGLADAISKFKSFPFDNINFAKIDTHREIRCGAPEVIFCPGKTIKQIKIIATKIMKNKNNLLATRANNKIATELKKISPKIKYNKLAKAVYYFKPSKKKLSGYILILTAGTADIPVAEEAYITTMLMNRKSEKIYDVGVAGIHRLLQYKDKLMGADAIVVAAGMEGALAGVVGGMVQCPVIGVPTSIGYGTNLKGFAPLLTMLNSCTPNVTVVNIDNGFAAGFVASLISSTS